MTYLRAEAELDNIIADLSFSAKTYFCMKFLFQNFHSASRNLIFKSFSFELRCGKTFTFHFSHTGNSIFDRDRSETDVGDFVRLEFFLEGRVGTQPLQNDFVPRTQGDASRAHQKAEET